MDITALRAATPGCANRVHLNNAGAALLAQPTLDAMTGHLEREALLGGYEAGEDAHEEIAATYDRIAALVGGRSDEVALFDNATRAWNAAFYSVPMRAGDRILTGRAEYGSNILAYLQVAQRTGAEVVVVPDDEHGQLDVGALEKLVDDRTRLIGISHVPTDGGLVNPAAEIGRVARAAGVPYLLDATQSVGQFPVDVEEIGCDMLSATGRKSSAAPGAPASSGSVRRCSTGSIRTSSRSARRTGSARAASPGRTAPPASRPGSTATSTCSGSAPRSARRSTSGSRRSAPAWWRSARYCATGSTPCPA